MKRSHTTILVVAVLAVLLWPGPAAHPESNARALKFTLGLRIDTESISLDGVFVLGQEKGLPGTEAGADGKWNVDQQSREVGAQKTHRVRLGLFPNFFPEVYKSFVTVRALQRTAGCVARHCFRSGICKLSHLKGPLDADRR